MTTQYMVVARFKDNRVTKFQSQVKEDLQEIRKVRDTLERSMKNSRFSKGFQHMEIWSREVTEWKEVKENETTTGYLRTTERR